ncbi:transcription factor HES-5-like [Gastrophryne carolinensis]
MAPISSPLMHCKDQQLIGGPRKLRKPVIEKMRRDRINFSIEQLRVLLEKEFQKSQLPSKPEKADILEMTVALLQQRMAEKNMTSSSQAHRDGYSACVRDSLNFLSLHTPTEVQLQLVKNLPGAQAGTLCPTAFPVCQTPAKHIAPGCDKALWRPW